MHQPQTFDRRSAPRDSPSRTEYTNWSIAIMAQRYPAHEIEARWRERWQASGIDTPDLDRAERPFYNLVEFPYPSGEGLHVGHVYTYCGADAYGRLRRMQGWDVFQPMGFDAFGIHSENYAIKLNVHPVELMPANIRRFRDEQLLHLGCAFDWTRTIDTSDPRYYRWTQWIFLKLYEAGLAYQAESPVNWCPKDQTVLANEQVIDGRCERCGTPIVQRVMRQWFLGITAYAERLLDFSNVDFPEASIKRMTAWIGRSEGADIRWQVEGSDATITTFTTRPDTIFGATFVALAPEHPLAPALASAEQRERVASYIIAAQRRLERERLEQPKSGVWTGAFAIHPLDGRRVPIWVADYVLARYGSGAIMGVPAHDQRDLEFAQLHSTSGQQRKDAKTQRIGNEPATIGAHPDTPSPRHPVTLLPALPAQDKIIDKAEAVLRLQEAGAGEAKTTYRLRDWLISRQRYWGPPIPIVYCADCGVVPVPEDQLPVLLPYVEDFRPRGVSPLEAATDWITTTCPRCGGPARREADVADTFLDSSWYYLRYTSSEYDDRAWDAERVRRWLPVDQYAGGPEHTTMHHLYARFVCKALYDLGLVPFDEPFARLRLHGMITKDGAKMSKSRGNVVSPDGYIRSWGSDVFRMYMLFLGPWQEGGDFTDAGIAGVARFAGRVWEWVLDTGASLDPQAEASAEAERRRHRTIERVQSAIVEQRFHVAIAALMEHLNWLRENSLAIDAHELARAKSAFVLVLAPFAPHLCEELWSRLGRPYSVHRQPWPEYDPALAADRTIEVPVQVAGKVRERLQVQAGTDNATLEQLALASASVQAALAGRVPARIVVVPDRMVNIVPG